MSLIPGWNHRQLKKKGRDFLSPFSNLFDEFEENLKSLVSHPSGLTVSSDDKFIYVEADVPGLTAKDVDVSIDNEGVLWIKGERIEEDKSKKYYRKAQHSFSYCVPLWNEIDESSEPQAICKDGVMRITFSRKKDNQPPEAKKIHVKEK